MCSKCAGWVFGARLSHSVVVKKILLSDILFPALLKNLANFCPFAEELIFFLFRPTLYVGKLDSHLYASTSLVHHGVSLVVSLNKSNNYSMALTWLLCACCHGSPEDWCWLGLRVLRRLKWPSENEGHVRLHHQLMFAIQPGAQTPWKTTGCW